MASRTPPQYRQLERALARLDASNKRDLAGQTKIKSSGLSAQHWDMVFKNSGVIDAQKELGSTDKSKLGKADKQAKALLKRIEASDVDLSVKKRARKIYEEGGGDDDGNTSLFGQIRGAAGNVVGGALTVLDKAKRGVVATIDEVAESSLGDLGLTGPLVGKLDEDGKSWMDNVFREKDYGYLNLLDRSLERSRAAEKDGSQTSEEAVQQAILRNGLAKFGLGLAGDVALDPTTYLTAGVSATGKLGKLDDVADAAKAATKLGKAEKGVDDARDAGVAAKSLIRQRLGKHQIAGRASAAGRDDLLAKVASGGKSALTQDELAELGLEGGVRLMGQVVVPHDVARRVGQGAGAIGGKLKGTKTVERAMSNIGADEIALARKVMRQGVDHPDLVAKIPDLAERQKYVADAVRTVAARKASHGSNAQLVSRLVAEVEPVMLDARKAGIDGATLRRAVLDPDSVTPEVRVFGDRYAAAMENVRGIVNEHVGEDWLQAGRRTLNPDGSLSDKGGRYIARHLTEDAKAIVSAKAGGAGSDFAKRGFEMAALRQGDELFGETLGTPQLATRFGNAVEDQVDGLFREAFGDDFLANGFYETDAFAITDRYVRGLAKRTGEKNFEQQLRGRGVLSRSELNPIQAPNPLEDTVTAAVGGPSALTQRAAELVDERSPLAAKLMDKAAVPHAQRRIDALLAADAVGADTAVRTILAANADDLVESTQDLALRLAGKGGPAGEQAQKAHEGAVLMAQATDPDVRRALALQVQSHDWQARAAERGLRGLPLDEATAMLRKADAKKIDYWKQSVKSGYDQFGNINFEEAPDFVVEAFTNMTKAVEDPAEWLKFVDATNRTFKTFAIMSPGFMVRNGMGAYFNNFVAGVTPASYNTFGRLMRQWRKHGDIARMPEKYRAYWNLVVESGLLSEETRIAGEMAPHISQDLVKLGERKLVSRSRPLTDNAVTRGMARGNERVEHYHRGALFLDTLLKGGNGDDALERVATFHFDYSDLSSKFERSFARRAVPFWTWTSRNMPLQLESILTRPQMYQKWNIVKSNVEAQSEEGGVVPDYMRDGQGMVRLPIGGGDKYLAVDLPFVSVDETMGALAGNPLASIMQDASPLAKTPIELYQGKQFFQGLPISDDPIPLQGGMRFLEPEMVALGLGKGRNDDGQLLVDGQLLYGLEQFMPLFGRMRRLFPSEEKYKSRWHTSVLSFLGIGARTNTEQTKTSEMYQRGDTLEEVLKLLEAQGNYVPKLREIDG